MLLRMTAPLLGGCRIAPMGFNEAGAMLLRMTRRNRRLNRRRSGFNRPEQCCG